MFLACTVTNLSYFVVCLYLCGLWQSRYQHKMIGFPVIFVGRLHKSLSVSFWCVLGFDIQYVNIVNIVSWLYTALYLIVTCNGLFGFIGWSAMTTVWRSYQ